MTPALAEKHRSEIARMAALGPYTEAELEEAVASLVSKGMCVLTLDNGYVRTEHGARTVHLALEGLSVDRFDQGNPSH